MAEQGKMPPKEKMGYRKSATSKQGSFKPARQGMTAGYPEKDLPSKKVNQ